MAPQFRNLQLIESLSSPSDMQRFEALLEEKYDYGFKRGEIVEGKVLYFDSHNAYVDIGAKTAAVLPAKELANRAPLDEELKIGETYEFYILREENEDGQWTLSQRRVAQAYTWKTLLEKMEKDDVMECKVVSVVKGGLLVDVMGLRGFVPASHIRSRTNYEEMVGQTIPLKILTVEQNRNNIILSHRKVVAEQLAEQRHNMFANLQVGSIVEGEVVRITDFGAFVDLGGIDGLLPLSQISWRWVEHPSDVLSIGDKVKVEIIGVDVDRQRVSLSVKSQQSDPWEAIVNEFNHGSAVTGKITRIKQFGAFVEIYPGVEALLPSKEMQDYETQTGEPLTSGQSIEVYIQKFNPEERRISLSFSQPYGAQPPIPEPFAEEAHS